MMSSPPSFLFPDSNEPFDLTLLSRVAAEEAEDRGNRSGESLALFIPLFSGSR